MSREQNIEITANGATKKEHRGERAVKNYDANSGAQMAVFSAMGLVVFATAFAAYREGYLSAVSAGLAGFCALITLVTLHRFMRHYKNTLSLAPRMDGIENVVANLKSEVAHVSEISQQFSQIDLLRSQVQDLQTRLDELRGDGGYPGNVRADATILQDVAGLEDELKGIRADFERANIDQRQQIDTELRLLQSLIKQVASKVSVRDFERSMPPIPETQRATDAEFEVDTQPPGMAVDVPPLPSVLEPVHEPEPVSSHASNAGAVTDEAFEERLSTSSRLETDFAAEVPSATNLLSDHDVIESVLRSEDEAPSQAPIAEAEETAFSFQELEQSLQGYQDPVPLELDIVEVVETAIERNRVDLYLQPIVGVGDRKVRYYEALARLRNSRGQLVMPVQFLGAAEQNGIIPLIDNAMLFRTVQVIQRLAERDSSRGIFCNISPLSLADPDFFPEFLAFMGENRQLSKHLFFEFPQHMLGSGGERVNEALAELANFGFQFSLDGVTNLNTDFNALSDRGFRFIKLDVRIFLHGMADAGARIHAADMSGYLRRYGLELVVERVEDEQSAASLVEYGVPLSQGFLFSEPRPVRPEIFDDGFETEAA